MGDISEVLAEGHAGMKETEDGPQGFTHAREALASEQYSQPSFLSF